MASKETIIVCNKNIVTVSEVLTRMWIVLDSLYNHDPFGHETWFSQNKNSTVHKLMDFVSLWSFSSFTVVKIILHKNTIQILFVIQNQYQYQYQSANNGAKGRLQTTINKNVHVLKMQHNTSKMFLRTFCPFVPVSLYTLYTVHYTIYDYTTIRLYNYAIQSIQSSLLRA